MQASNLTKTVLPYSLKTTIIHVCQKSDSLEQERVIWFYIVNKLTTVVILTLFCYNMVCTFSIHPVVVIFQDCNALNVCCAHKSKTKFNNWVHFNFQGDILHARESPLILHHTSQKFPNIYMPRETHKCITPPVRSLPNVAFKIVPTLVCWHWLDCTSVKLSRILSWPGVEVMMSMIWPV